MDKALKLKFISRIHLDLLGGISGDMFLSALFDVWPELINEFTKDISSSEFRDKFIISIDSHTDNILSGSKITIKYTKTLNQRSTTWQEIHSRIDKSNLPNSTKTIAIKIFTELALAESKVHGVKPEDITFHELGAWDSIADILTSAWLINRLSHVKWSASSLPLGSGRIDTHHGKLPVPVPAVTELLKGFETFDDGISGERITPTGAAIIAYLKPDQSNHHNTEIIEGTGVGFGKSIFPNISNILRVVLFSDSSVKTDFMTEEITVLNFTVDDQTPEDLSIALETIRNTIGVLDIYQSQVYGKKGRVAFNINVLTRVKQRESIIKICFQETTTLGIRWHITKRAVLSRVIKTDYNTGVKVKLATRPNGETTAKAEIDDIKTFGDHEARIKARGNAEKNVKTNQK